MKNIKVYNSLGKQKQDFNPLGEEVVNIYTCGVTVYDDCHIGHARSLYIFEVIRRYLSYKGYKVNFIRNITDIDDKIIKRANELGVGWKELVDKYIKRYQQDLKALGVGEADSEPRATDNIDNMITYIKGLIEKGFAYETESGVYFRIRKFKDYGKLSGQSIDDMQSSARINSDEAKKDPLDFALWKKAKEGEPSWESPWGPGRPGWHIECSVMSQKYLGVNTLDIHGGGRDLIFPHHENELTQAESLTGKPFAKYWLHHGLLTIEDQKMAKSLGNFYTIKEVLKKYPADVLKLFYLQAHYSSSIDFSWERMDEVKKAYERLVILKDKIQRLEKPKAIQSSKIADEFRDKFNQAMDDDFNMPKGLGVLFDLLNSINKLFEEENKNFADIFALGEVFNDIVNIFIFDFAIQTTDSISNEEVEKLIQLRLKHKNNKNYQAADKIREELQQKGIILEDAKEGTTWRKKI